MYVRTPQLARAGFRDRSQPGDDGNIRPRQNFGMGELIVPPVPSLNNPWQVRYPTSYNRRAPSDLRGLGQFFPAPGAGLSPGSGDTGSVYGDYPGQTPPSGPAPVTLPVTFQVTSAAPYPPSAWPGSSPAQPSSIPSSPTLTQLSMLATAQSVIPGVQNWVLLAAAVALVAVIGSSKRRR